ncbi:MAG: nucleotidyltransferase family protein [Anaerolineae bacterium]|nr:nucleotidyltransferase family protein [Anaerolineae bacterium]
MKTWPSSSQKALLRATFLSGDEGIKAFETWKSQIDMADHADLGSFRLLPFLFHHLKTQGIDDPLLMKLKGIARRNWYKNQAFFRRWAPLLQALHQAQITCMMLSGPALAWDEYRDYALDSEMELALLVPSKQAQAAIHQLQALGWQPNKPLPNDLLGPYIKAEWMQCFKDAAGRKLCLHWHLFPAGRTAVAEADIWGAATTTKMHDVPIHLLNPVDQILYSCFKDHATTDTARFLRAIDLMLILQNTPNFNWNRLCSQAQRHRLIVPLLETLGYIQSTLDEPLPSAVWQQFRAFPITRQEQLEYRLKTNYPEAWYHIWQLWFYYRCRTAQTSLIRDVVGFPQHLQHIWRLRKLHQVPRRAMGIVRRQLQQHFFYHQRVGR